MAAPGNGPYYCFELVQVIKDFLLSGQVFVMQFCLTAGNMAIVDVDTGKLVPKFANTLLVHDIIPQIDMLV